MARLAKFDCSLCLPSRIQTIIDAMGSGESGGYLFCEGSRDGLFFLDESVDTLQL